MNAIGRSTWKGSWKQGSGTISTESETLNYAPYTFASKIRERSRCKPGRAARRGSCRLFNQALANNFGMIGSEAGFINTSVTIEFGNSIAGHPAITKSHITVEAIVETSLRSNFNIAQSRPDLTARYQSY